MDGFAGQKAPWHLWLIGIVSLVWNGSNGALDHILIGMRNEAYLTDIAEILGIPVAAVFNYYDAWPLWATFGWAAAVWGLVAGSLFLLLRSKYALHAFAASLLGQLVTAYFYSFAPLPRVAGDQLVEFIDRFQEVSELISLAVTLLIMLYTFLMIRKRVLE